MSELTHFNEQGRAKMVDVTDKAVTHRTAVAAGEIHMAPETLQKIKDGTMKKGDVLAVAQVAGIQAAKHNWELIPMCHPLPLTGIDITDPDYVVYGLSVQSSEAEFASAMERLGFPLIETERGLSADWGNGFISFEPGRIKMRANASNRDGIVF